MMYCVTANYSEKQFPAITFAAECEAELLPFLNARRVTEEK